MAPLETRGSSRRPLPHGPHVAFEVEARTSRKRDRMQGLQRPTFLFLRLLALVISTGTAVAEGPRLIGPFTKDDYPQAVIDRPLTLPAGMVEVEAGSR